MNTSLAPTGYLLPPSGHENRYAYLLRPVTRPDKTKPITVGHPDDETEEETGEAIVCRQCLRTITFPRERSTVNGAHTHTFANPEGIVFEIACYGKADGCGYVGAASSEFTWFPGYVWRIAVCGYCHVHLGWRFSAADSHFFHGLITSRLMVGG